MNELTGRSFLERIAELVIAWQALSRTSARLTRIQCLEVDMASRQLLFPFTSLWRRCCKLNGIWVSKADHCENCTGIVRRISMLGSDIAYVFVSRITELVDVNNIDTRMLQASATASMSQITLLEQTAYYRTDTLAEIVSSLVLHYDDCPRLSLSFKFFKSVLLAITIASRSFAAPWLNSSNIVTPQIRDTGMDIESFYPESTFETFGDGIDHPMSKRDDFDLEAAAKAFIQSRLNVDSDTVAFRSGFSSDVAKHAFIKQQINGIPIANAVANVAFNNDKVVSFGSSFVKPTSIPSITPSISVDDAISKAESALSGKFNDHPPTIEFIAKQDGSVALAHVVQVQNNDVGVWFEAFVDAHTGDIVHITNFVAKAAYLAIPITNANPFGGFQVLNNPQDYSASPYGWHNTGTGETFDTSGNNAIAYKGIQSSTAIQSSSYQNFTYVQDPNQDPTVAVNLNAAITNAFYVTNTLHDISYKYGFTEAAFNFQNNNFDRGGARNDRVLIAVQNPAFFATPPDGQSGYMQLLLWTYTQPSRDVSFENDIVTHEFTHGISNRLIGGGTGQCLQIAEALGLGEGWSDAMAEWTSHTSAAVPDYVIGAYVTNNPAGIRRYPYSTSATTNPLRYSSLQLSTEPHAIGEVWANMLHNVYARLVAVNGFSQDAHTNPTSAGGNTVFLHLFIDSMSLMPCNPTFLAARNTWIQADINRYGGRNYCLLWNAFASRGLGLYAANHQDDFTVPLGC
ncbi:Extracellular metalloproteinase 5 [Grifola frondosa]|uniref:Extracellular metalloproteinase n=1 Tax=Grifola frondosa TaxID=5627 RepID=A0A1C7M249_GRIFR|nr:Extracellular metalloproteinase 5 [Grifola frondosa]